MSGRAALDVLVRFTVTDAEGEEGARRYLSDLLGRSGLVQRRAEHDAGEPDVDSWALLHEHQALRIGEHGRILRLAEETEEGEPADGLPHEVSVLRDFLWGMDVGPVPPLHVRCCSEGCPNAGTVINTISDFDTLEDRADVVEGWEGAHEDADVCKACGVLGVPDATGDDPEDDPETVREREAADAALRVLHERAAAADPAPSPLDACRAFVAALPWLEQSFPVEHNDAVAFRDLRAKISRAAERGSSRLLGLVLAAVVAGLALACLVVFR